MAMTMRYDSRLCPPSSVPRPRRGLTLVELTLGLIILTIVTGALAGLTLAVSQGWQHSGEAMEEMRAGQQGTTVLGRTMRRAKMIGTFRPGALDGSGEPAAVVIWKDDANADGLIQFGEVALIEHDTTQTGEHGPSVKIYEPPPTTPPDVSQQVVGPEFITSPTAVEDIKNHPDVVTAPPTVLAAHVEAVEFAVPLNGTGQRPLFDFVLKHRKKDRAGEWRERIRTGSAGLRGHGDGYGLEED